MKKITLVLLIATAAASFALGWFTKPEPKELFNKGILKSCIVLNKTLSSHDSQSEDQFSVLHKQNDIDFNMYVNYDTTSIHFLTDEKTFNSFSVNDTINVLIISK